MTAISLDLLFNRHVPNAVEKLTLDLSTEMGYLNIAHRLIDEFWMDNQSHFVRHSTQGLTLLKDFDDGDRSPEVILKGFMAAELERRIEPAMTIEQRERLGNVYQCLGDSFLSIRWRAHARFSFSRAAHLFGDLRLHQREDDCWYREAKVAMIQSKGSALIRAYPLYLFAGFGYRPYRLLYFCFITVVAFSAIYMYISPSWTPFECISVSSMNYLSALGYSDVSDSTTLVQSLVIIQGFCSLVLNSTLFALLVRKWFRS